MNRRKFLQYASLLTAAGLTPIGLQGWAARGMASTNTNKRLIVIFLRGGIDGLNVVVPYQDPDYYEARPRIAIPQPKEKGGVLDLDGRFGLHPALSDLIPLWKQGSLAFIHACGSPDTTRSHFDAQNYMESGTPGDKTTSDGWMNRLLATLPQAGPTQAVNIGSMISPILMGQHSVASLPPGNKATRSLSVDRSQLNTAFERLYRGNDSIHLAYQEGQQAREILLATLAAEMREADNGAPPANGFAKDTRNLARLMVGDSQTQLAFMALGGWDTHINQGSSQGQFANKLKSLAQGLVTLVKELGSLYSDTAIAILSEFGRTVKENGNGGTDHGHGNVMWMLGGGIRGGKVYGEWSGLSESALFQGRDLAVTTDFRDAIASILEQHIQLKANQVAQVFPGFTSNHRLQSAWK